MTTNKNTLFVMCAVALLALSACHKQADKTVTVQEWSVDESFDFGTPAFIEVSGDGQHAYIAAKDGAKHVLYHSTGEFKSWAQLAYAEVFDGTQAGKADLKNKTEIVRMSAAQSGVLISVREPGSTGNAGAIYINGQNPNAAWEYKAHLPPGFLINPVKLNAAVVRNKNGAELLVGATASGLGLIGELKPQQIGARLNESAGGKFASVKSRSIVSFGGLAMVGPDVWFFEPTKGLGRIKGDNLAVTGTVTAEAASSAGQAGGVDTFGTNGGNANALNATHLFESVAKLYVSFSSTGTEHSGGVAVCTFKSTGEVETCKNDASWNKVSVKRITKDPEGRLWAVTGAGLVQIKEDGTKGDLWGQETFTGRYDNTEDGGVYEQNRAQVTGGLTLNVQNAVFAKDGQLFMLAADPAQGRGKLIVIRPTQVTVKAE